MPHRARCCALVALGVIGLFGFVRALAAQAPAGSAPQATGPVTPVLVELFTSEGCSSCPPADRLLMELLSTQPVPGVRIIGLSEHVDYWDRLGWKDPFSSAGFSRRQSAYAEASGSADVYTPQIIVDGTAAFVGSDRAQAMTAIRAAAERPKASLQLAWTSADHRDVEITVPAAASLARAQVFMAVAEDDLRTQVRRGENEGRELAHDAVTRRLTALGTTDRAGSFHRVVPAALDPAWKRGALRVVVFVQRDMGSVAAVSELDVK